MNRRFPDQETLLEIGLILFAVALLGGFALLVAGRTAGAVVRGKRRAQGPPSPGTIPPNRHSHVAASAAR